MQHKTIITKLGGYEQLADELDCPAATVKSWYYRNSIAVDEWAGVIWVAKRQKMPITLEDLHNGLPKK